MNFTDQKIVKKPRSFFSENLDVTKWENVEAEMKNLLIVGCLLAVVGVQAETLKVGPAEKYRKPSKAIAAAKDGDVIEIDTSGDYNQDVAVIRRNNLTLRGVGKGRAKLDAKGMHASGKGIWVIKGNDITVEKIDFIGARVEDRHR